VPQVASDPKTYASTVPLPYTRAPQALDRASASPFESLLDDTGHTPDNGPPPPADANAPAEPAQVADQAASGKPAKAANNAPSSAKSDPKPNATDDANPANGDAIIHNIGAPAIDPKAVKTAKAAADIKNAKKLAENTAGRDDAKTAVDAKSDAKNDAKPADGAPVTPGGATAVQAAPVTVVAATDATASGLLPGAAPQEETQPAAKAAGDSAIVAAATAKFEKPASPKADAGKATEDLKQTIKPAAQTTTQTAAQLHSDAKPQATDDDDNNAGAQTRSETSAKDDRIAATHGTGATTTELNSVAPKAGNDVIQPALLSGPQQTAAPAVNNVATAPQLAPQAAAIPLAGVAFEITNKALAGTNHFEIRLDPPELGRIEVRLEVDRDGNVTSRMIADRADTLDLLRRDAPGLERALQDAGLKTAENGLQFSLRDQSSNQQQNSGDAPTARLVVSDDVIPVTDATQRIYSRPAGQGSGVDIHV